MSKHLPKRLYLGQKRSFYLWAFQTASEDDSQSNNSNDRQAEILQSAAQWPYLKPGQALRIALALLLVAVAAVFAPRPAAAQVFAPIRINAGGPAFTDSTGQVWAADNNFSGGSTFSVAATTAISGTVEDTLYRSERYGNFSYNIPVPNGTYDVTLAFAEIYWTSAGQRLFNVSIEGQPVLSNLDIFATAGANAALNRTFQTAVTDGTLNITFVTVNDNAKVSAVQVVAVPGATNTAPSISDVTDRNTAEDTGTGAIAFTVGDAETAAGSLTVTGASSNVGLVPVGNIVFGGTGANRTVTVTPATNQTGSATITVTVSDGQEIASSSFLLTVTTGSSVPVAFNAPQAVATATPTNPTQAAWGPDGRLYVGTITGQIAIYTFDDNYSVIDTQMINGVSGLSNSNILGIAFNPFDPPSPVRVYISHSALFANGGACFSGTSAYPGQVSRLDGPSFSSIAPIITGLSVSNHEHGVNGLVFDNNGDLLIAQGGNTNGGVAGNCNIGQLPESPLSAAILKAQITKPGFNGAITYRSSSSGQSQNDQNFGESVDVAPGVDVSVWAPGFRNPFDIVLTTEGRLYATDNGPNGGFGAASTSATTQAPDPTAPDEVLRVAQGSYYGHPNRSRGRYAPRENVYRDPSVPAILGQYTAPLATVGSSSDGIDEYRATTFNSAMRGNLLVQQLNGVLYQAQLNTAGTAITSVQTIANAVGLDVLTGPGGAILTIDYEGSQIKVLKPNDAGAPSVAAYDIFPWRGRADGLTPFVIGGVGLGGNTTVTIGGAVATLTSVSSTRIRGLIPAKTNPTADLVDVVVQSAGQVSTITRAFRYLLNSGAGTGVWRSAPNLPQTIGEVAGGVIDGVMYMVGEGNATTFAFDLATQTWQTVAPRPFVGDHHAAEVIDGELYLFGGLGGGSEGQVQIFDPWSNSWSLGAPAPFASGSAATALINGRVYMAGGIAGGATVNSAAVYDPVTNTWSSIAGMPAARNHAASGSDGQRFFIFGGRGPGSGDGNTVAEGFADVQIYNPATNTWQCSCTLGSTIPPLPQNRGGMGKAAFFRGEFYVIGGETTSSGTGQVAGNVYNRVDVYNPTTALWRLDSPLPTARHGIFPLTYDDRIFVAGGGVQASFSSSFVLEVFER